MIYLFLFIVSLTFADESSKDFERLLHKFPLVDGFINYDEMDTLRDLNQDRRQMDSLYRILDNRGLKVSDSLLHDTYDKTCILLSGLLQMPDQQLEAIYSEANPRMAAFLDQYAKAKPHSKPLLKKITKLQNSIKDEKLRRLGFTKSQIEEHRWIELRFWQKIFATEQPELYRRAQALLTKGAVSNKLLHVRSAELYTFGRYQETLNLFDSLNGYWKKMAVVDEDFRIFIHLVYLSAAKLNQNMDARSLLIIQNLSGKVIEKQAFIDLSTYSNPEIFAKNPEALTTWVTAGMKWGVDWDYLMTRPGTDSTFIKERDRQLGASKK